MTVGELRKAIEVVEDDVQVVKIAEDEKVTPLESAGIETLLLFDDGVYKPHSKVTCFALR